MDIFDIIKKYTSFGRIGFYLLVVYAVALIIATVAWCVSLVIEVTRKRASKLSVKYGSASETENKLHIKKLIVEGVLVVIAWIVFLLVL